MSDKEKWVDLGEITPQFRLEGKKLQIKYPEEDWQDLADFSTIASSLDLRLNEEAKLIEMKRDENSEWETLFDFSQLGGGGIKTVQTYRDLPTDAKEGDVCLVLEDGYGEDDWRQLSMNDILVERFPSQISFANTLEEMMQMCTFDRDNMLSGFANKGILLSCSDNKNYALMFCHVKMEGIECTAIMINEMVDSDSMSGYVITDDFDIFAMMMEIELDTEVTANVWNKFNISYVPTEDGEDYEMVITFTEIEKAPVITGVTLIEASDLLYHNYNSPDNGHYDYHYDIPRIKLFESTISLCLGNFADSMPKGLYCFSDGLWSSTYPQDRTKEFYYYDYNSGKSRESGNYWITDLPPGKKGEIAKAYPRVMYRDEAYEPMFNVPAVWLNNIVRVGNTDDKYSAADYVASEYYLPNEIPQSLLDTLNRKTIVIGGSLGNSWCNGYIAFADGTVLVVGDDSYEGFIYTSTANKVFTFDDFTDIDDELDTSLSFLLKESGWYSFSDGLVVKCNSHHLSIKDMMCSGYINTNPKTVFILDGLTTRVPEVLETNTYIDLSGLFYGCNPSYYFDNINIRYYTWDYEFSVFIKYSSSEGWQEYFPSIDSAKLKQAHNHDNMSILKLIQYSTQLNPPINYERAKIKNNYDFNPLYDKHGVGGLEFEQTDKAYNSDSKFKRAVCYNNLPSGDITVNRMGAATPFYSAYNGTIYYDWYIHDGVLDDFSGDNMPTFNLIKRKYEDDNLKRRYLYAARNCFKNVTVFGRGNYYQNYVPSYDVCGVFGNWGGTTLPYFSTENAVDCEAMFAPNSNLRVLPFMSSSDFFDNVIDYGSPLNFSKCENMDYCFYGCRNLIAIGAIYFGSHVPDYGYKGIVINTSKMKRAFEQCESLEYLTIIGRIKVDSDDLSFIDSPNLRNDCVQTILDALQSNVGEETQYTVYFHENVYNALTDVQKAIATNKNILLSYTK